MFDKPVRKNEAEKQLTRTSVQELLKHFLIIQEKEAVFRYLKDDIIETYLVNLTFPKLI